MRDFSKGVAVFFIVPEEAEVSGKAPLMAADYVIFLQHTLCQKSPQSAINDINVAKGEEIVPGELILVNKAEGRLQITKLVGMCRIEINV